MSRYVRYILVMFIALMGMAGSAGALLAGPGTGADGDVSVAQAATGTVAASVYICDGQEGVIWGGSPGATCYAGSASLVFYLIGDGTDDNWTVNASPNGSATLPAGNYEVWENVYWTTGSVSITAGATTNVILLLPGNALPPPPAPATGTVSVSDYVCAGQTGVVWYGTPGANCGPGAATFYFYLIGDGTDDSWTLSVNGTNSRSLPVGTYEVYESVSWTTANVTISANGTTYVNVLHPGAAVPPPTPANGTVTINKYDCDGLTTVAWNGTPDANCGPGAATFYFYLIGDGLDTFWTLNVNGSNSISLAPGTYEVWENGTWSMANVTVTSNQTTTVNVLNPGDPLPPPAPATGTVSMSKYVCDGQTGVIWGGTPGATCSAGKATFYFYLIGDGTDDYWTLNVNGTNSRTLPAGTYEVWEAGYWTMEHVTITADQTTSVNVLNPGKPLPPPPPPTGTVEISKYDCNGIDTVVWNGSPDDNCDDGDATFYFYLIGDGTADYWVLNVDGTDSINLPVGTYEVWEDGTWSMHNIIVTQGATTEVNVLNPDD